MIEHLLALRYSVEDSTLVDCLQLDQWLPSTPCQIRTAELRRRWHCSQATVSRRITRLWEADLIDYRAGGGRYRIKRLGPRSYPDLWAASLP